MSTLALTHWPGEPERLPYRENLELIRVTGGAGLRWSEPMPYREVLGIPHWLPAGFFALPPLLWLTARSRRRYVRRRRLRLGLSPRCGNNPTGNTSGKCGEALQPGLAIRSSPC